MVNAYPISGAVVLETQQQYEQNNLTPADKNKVPHVSSPNIILLLIAGIGFLLIRARRALN